MGALLAATGFTFQVTPNPGGAPGGAGVQSAIDVIAAYALYASAAGFPARRCDLGGRRADRQRLHRDRREDRHVHRDRRRVRDRSGPEGPAMGLRARLDADERGTRPDRVRRPARAVRARGRRADRTCHQSCPPRQLRGGRDGSRDRGWRRGHAAGALAAADNYVAIASQTVEQDPGEFAELVATVYTPAARTSTLAQATRVRAADGADMRNYAQGGRAVAVIAARRLDRYTPARARVTSWLGGFVWVRGSHRARAGTSSTPHSAGNTGAGSCPR